MARFLFGKWKRYFIEGDKKKPLISKAKQNQHKSTSSLVTPNCSNCWTSFKPKLTKLSLIISRSLFSPLRDDSFMFWPNRRWYPAFIMKSQNILHAKFLKNYLPKIVTKFFQSARVPLWLFRQIFPTSASTASCFKVIVITQKSMGKSLSSVFIGPSNEISLKLEKSLSFFTNGSILNNHLWFFL